MGDLNFFHDIVIGLDHTKTLMRIMGMEPIYPKPKPKNTSDPDELHKKYPYLLGGFKFKRPNQVWQIDITYIRLEHGFCYLVAIIDCYSRYVLSWKISNTLEIDFCLEVYNEAIVKFGAPEIINSDQGSHFTSPKFIAISEGNDVKISMTGKGRCLDNVYIERLWRSVKYEDIFIYSYVDIPEVKIGIDKYFQFYNNIRPHKEFKNKKRPAEIYFEN